MSHRPTCYALSFATSADVTACADPIDSGDTCYVSDIDETFIYDATSTEAARAQVVILGHGGVGRWILQERHVYGGLYCHQGATPQSVSGVATKVTCWNGITSAYKVTPSTVTDDITIVKPGAYSLDLSISGTAGGNLVFNFHIYVNGAEIPATDVIRLGSTNNPTGGTVGTFYELAIGDVVACYVSATGSGSFTITSATLRVTRLG